MNKIVLEHYPVANLPEDLRQGLPTDASVKITVEQEERRPFSKEQLHSQLTEARKHLKRNVTVEEAVARVRELRDEWDD